MWLHKGSHPASNIAWFTGAYIDFKDSENPSIKAFYAEGYQDEQGKFVNMCLDDKFLLLQGEDYLNALTVILGGPIVGFTSTVEETMKTFLGDT